MCLLNWKKEDIPIVEHLRHNNNCLHALKLNAIELLLNRQHIFPTKNAVRRPSIKNASVQTVAPVLLNRQPIFPKKIGLLQPNTKNASVQTYAPIFKQTVELCQICSVSPKDTLFLPCLHLISCQHCSKNATCCAACRHLIQSSIKVLHYC